MRRLIVLTALLVAGCARPPADDAYTAIYRRLHPSIAYFTMQIPADDPKRKGQWDDAYGTGIVVASGAWGTWLLTDAHVIADARDLRAVVGDAGRAQPARVIARSNDDDDLALLAIPTPNLPVVAVDGAARVEPGTPIGILGYPIPDEFEDEHLRRTVSLYAGRIASVRNGALELDAPIVPGESGGPVFDARSGAIVGLAESRFDDERAIGFATPADVVARFLTPHLGRLAKESP